MNARNPNVCRTSFVLFLPRTAVNAHDDSWNEIIESTGWVQTTNPPKRHLDTVFVLNHTKGYVICIVFVLTTSETVIFRRENIVYPQCFRSNSNDPTELFDVKNELIIICFKKTHGVLCDLTNERVGRLFRPSWVQYEFEVRLKHVNSTIASVQSHIRSFCTRSAAFSHGFSWREESEIESFIIIMYAAYVCAYYAYRPAPDFGNIYIWPGVPRTRSSWVRVSYADNICILYIMCECVFVWVEFFFSRSMCNKSERLYKLIAHGRRPGVVEDGDGDDDYDDFGQLRRRRCV